MTKTFLKNGTEYMQMLIREAVHNGSRTATVRGNWEIESEVRIPDDFTLYLKDCHLKMADGVFSNMFVNKNQNTDIGRTVTGTNRNIKIIGNKNAILDGGTYNGLSEFTTKDMGIPMWRNNLLLFTNVDGFEVTGIQARNQRWWALNFVYCRDGYIHDIDFLADDTGIDENGNVYHGLKRDKYSEIKVKNADGIDLRQGCNNIVIENITGFTEDDTVALTGVHGSCEKAFGVEELPSDICNVTIRNIASSAFCSNVRLLNQCDVKLHDILVDGVYDMSLNSPHMDIGGYCVRVGDGKYMYGERPSTEDETYNITVKNVRSRARYALHLGGAMKNLILENIETFDGGQYIEDMR